MMLYCQQPNPTDHHTLQQERDQRRSNVSTGSKKEINFSRAKKRKSSSFDIQDWKVLDSKDMKSLVKGDTTLTMLLNGCKNQW